MIDFDERLKSDKALAKKEGKKLCHAVKFDRAFRGRAEHRVGFFDFGIGRRLGVADHPIHRCDDF